MAAKLLLCVSNDQATVAVWRRRRLASCTRFENNEEGWISFGNFLRGAHGLPVHIIVDTVEEDFRFETLPHIRGRDRTEMVGRKLKQLYRATPYYSYALQERETGKRRDHREANDQGRGAQPLPHGSASQVVPPGIPFRCRGAETTPTPQRALHSSRRLRPEAS